ncbi:MAG: oligoendopeptidase F [Puniceicoccales bacterium]|jgi:oligoendopeptidase F|nr:oligoendopeptidase F [Puniceicoccales bacterium]
MFSPKTSLNTLCKCAAGAIALAAFTPFSGAKPDTLDRDKIPAQYKWDVSHIYANWDAWEKAYADTEKKIEGLAKLKGTLAKGPQALLTAQKAMSEISMELSTIYCYTALQRDSDSRDQKVSANFQRYGVLGAKFDTATSWFTPELLAIPESTMDQWLASTPGLAVYRYPIKKAYGVKEHILDEKAEKILSYGTRFGSTPRSIFQELSISDVKFPSVTLSDGKEVTLTPATYQLLVQTNPNQADRAKVAETYFSTFESSINTYAAIYNGILQRGWFNAQARNYPSTLSATLNSNDIPETVVTNLIETVRKGTAPLQRYMRLRQKLLKLDTNHLYDQTIPIYEDSDKVWAYEDAKKIVLKAVAPLGEEYQSKLGVYLNKSQIDVYENSGKRSGAYNMGIYRTGPYVLLNYNETNDAVFTLAHELGHSMHSILSSEYEPYPTAHYTIFVAEVASTLNERLLLDELLSQTQDPKERFLLIQHAVDSIVRTFYSQTLYADYELQAHQRVERGEPITPQVLTNIWADLYKAYYGDSTIIDPWYTKNWARIPHFYNSPYYVYQYATCFASSAQIYKAMKTGDTASRKAATERYLTLIKSGGNNYPMEQLKKAGVDLNQKETIQAVIDQMDQLVSQLEAEAAKIK